MPELPEVEFARKQLSRWMKKAKIVRAVVADARILDAKVKGPSIEKALKGRSIKSVERRGKWLRIVLDEGKIFSHFGMTGKWVLAESRRLQCASKKFDSMSRTGKNHLSVLLCRSTIVRPLRRSLKEDVKSWSFARTRSIDRRDRRRRAS